MNAIDQFLEYETERKEKTAASAERVEQLRAQMQQEVDKLNQRHEELRTDPRVRRSAMIGGAIGGAIHGAGAGARNLGTIGGALGGAAVGGALGAGGGAVMTSELARKHPIAVGTVAPIAMIPGGGIGAATGLAREQGNIDPRLLTERGHALFRTKHRKKKTAAVPGVASLVGPQVGEEIARRGFLRTLGRTTAGIGTVALGSLAVGAGLKGMDRLIDRVAGSLQRARGYKAMVEANPDLKKMDRQKVEGAYNTLHKFNPEMASDPLVSSSFVRRTAEMGQVSPMDVGNMMAARDRAKGPSAAEYGGQFASVGVNLAERDQDINRQVQLQQALIPGRVQEQRALAPGEIAKAKAIHGAQAQKQLAMAPLMGEATEAGKIRAQVGHFSSSLAHQKAFHQEAGKDAFRQQQETAQRSTDRMAADAAFERLQGKRG